MDKQDVANTLQNITWEAWEKEDKTFYKLADRKRVKESQEIT